MKDYGLQGKWVLVTGAGQGIGEAVATILAEQGAFVAMLDSNPDKLYSVSSRLNDSGFHSRAFQTDVSSSRAVTETVEQIERTLGPIYGLVHTAGILRMGAIASYRDEDWADTLAVNLTGVFHVSRAVSSYMMSRRSGAIVTVASNASAVPRMNMSAYAATKAAAAHFTKCLGLELAAYGIRCNVVSPGSTDTAMLRSMWSSEEDQQRTIAGSLEAFRTGIPLGRIAVPTDIAEAVLFMLSDQARHITMHDLRVDGGATLGV